MLVPTNLANQDGSTALTAASHKGHIDTVRLLLDAGADKHLADKGSSTALMLASQVGHRESLGLLYWVSVKAKAATNGAKALS